jgi:hypothetical protein
MLDVSNLKVDRHLMDNDNFSNVKIVEPTSSASIASLCTLRKEFFVAMLTPVGVMHARVIWCSCAGM